MSDNPTGQNLSAAPGGPPGKARKNSTWMITWLILGALVTGAALGQYLHGFKIEGTPEATGTFDAWMTNLQFVGEDIFIGLLKMLIIPLIVSSIIVGITSIGDFRKLGRIGLKTLVYYIVTMLIAITIGLTLVNLVQPGTDITSERLAQAEAEFDADTGVKQKVEKAPGGFDVAVRNIITSIIPTNPIASAANPKIDALPVIFFSIFFGVLLTTIGAKKDVVVSFMDAVFEVMMKMVHVIIWLAPIGVFCLLAWSIGRIGLESFAGAMFKYVATVIGGLVIHAFIVLPLVLRIFGRTSPFVYMHRMRQALLTAFSTDSSSATLPVTIETAIEEGECSEKAAGFVLPLGATINMDGTALFETVAVVFIAQAYGVELGLTENLIIALTATLTAVGAAGIPSASLVMIPVVIAAINQSLTGADPNAAVIPVAGIGLIYGLDRILDMSRTTVNVWGDAVGAKIISRSEPDP